jgi:peptidyl-prolyl cis-trans isomerase C
MVIAKVNEVEIMEEEVEKEVQNIIAQHQNNFTPEQIETAKPKIRQQAVEATINKYLLNFKVSQNNIQISPEQVEQEFDAITKRFPSQDAFEDQLKQVGITGDQIKSDLEQQLKVDLLVRTHISGLELKVTEQEVSGFFNDNPDNFKMPERVKASHVLFKVDPDASNDLKAQKRLELSSLLGKIEKGAEFANIAKQHSECPSKEQGGDLGFFDRGKMVKPFEDIAFKLNVGEVSEIVETKFGYHIIKLMERKTAETATFDEVKDKIFQHLVAVKEQDAFVQYIETLRKAANIDYGPEV